MGIFYVYSPTVLPLIVSPCVDVDRTAVRRYPMLLKLDGNVPPAPAIPPGAPAEPVIASVGRSTVDLEWELPENEGTATIVMLVPPPLPARACGLTLAPSVGSRCSGVLTTTGQTNRN